MLTWPVEPLALGDVVDLSVDGDAHAALLPRAVVLLQLDQRHVLLLEGRQRRRGRRQVRLCQEDTYPFMSVHKLSVYLIQFQIRCLHEILMSFERKGGFCMTVRFEYLIIRDLVCSRW